MSDEEWIANLIKVRNLDLKEREIILVTVRSSASRTPLGPRASCGIIIREGQPFHSSIESRGGGFGEKRATPLTNWHGTSNGDAAR